MLDLAKYNPKVFLSKLNIPLGNSISLLQYSSTIKLIKKVGVLPPSSS